MLLRIRGGERGHPGAKIRAFQMGPLTPRPKFLNFPFDRLTKQLRSNCMASFLPSQIGARQVHEGEKKWMRS